MKGFAVLITIISTAGIVFSAVYSNWASLGFAISSLMGAILLLRSEDELEMYKAMHQQHYGFKDPKDTK